MKPTQYINIQEILEKRIKQGVYAVGSKLPSEEQLSAEFGVNRHTIRRALKHLVDCNYLKRAPRIGSIVLSSSPAVPQTRRLKIKYVFFPEGSESNSERKQFFSQICGRFSKENPEIEIELTPIQRQGQLFSPNLPVHDSLDAAIVARVDYISDYAMRGVFLPLEDFDDITEVTSCLDGRLIRHTCGIDNRNHIHALPVQMAVWMMAVNISLLKKLGFSVKDIPETWDQFLSITAKIAKQGAKKGILPFEPILRHTGQQSITRYLPYLYSASAKGLFTETGDGLQINREAAEEFLKWISQMYALVPESTYPNGQLFKNNNVVFRLSVTSGFFKEIMDMKTFEVLPFPIPSHRNSRNPSTVVNAAFAGILSHSASTPERKQAAWKFIKYLCSEYVQRMAFEQLGDLPARPDMYSCVSSDQDIGGKFFDIAMKYGRKAYDYPYNTDIHRIVNKAFSNAALGLSSPSDAIDEAQFMLNHYTFKKNNGNLNQPIMEAL